MGVGLAGALVGGLLFRAFGFGPLSTRCRYRYATSSPPSSDR
jgi:hypothetical protein